ncbi:LysR substrate-binding domain-containing protein, partial [Chitinimonas sp.]|uniref:LysR substrate-binding domain-containing protein n=1 Tax=Chitinimonas sp. TaxID=1934313 RepID=UPI002F94199B
LRFMPKLDKESRLLREGTVDMETGVVGDDTSPEIRTRVLYHDRFVGVVRPGHPLSRGKPTLARYAAGQHVVVMRRNLSRNNLVDEALAASGLSRDVALIVGGFGTAVALARSCDLIATVPERHTAGLREGLYSFVLPFAVPEITISLLWHPRHDADPAHKWLRERLRAVCAGEAA